MKPGRLFSCLVLVALAAVSARAEGSATAAAPTLYSSDQLLADVTRLLQEHFRMEGELDLTLQRPWNPPERGAAQWQLAIAEYPGLPSANMLVRVRLKADGQAVDNSTLLVHASLWKDVWYARQPIDGNTVFSPALLDVRRADVLRERDLLPAKDGDDSYIFSHQIQPDHAITWHDVARRPLVHRGEVVDVTASEGRLTITMKALAMENGARGDLVTVRNLESRKDVSAIVTGDDRVEIRF